MNAYTRSQRHAAKVRQHARIIEAVAIVISAGAYVLAKLAAWSMYNRCNR